MTTAWRYLLDRPPGLVVLRFDTPTAVLGEEARAAGHRLLVAPVGSATDKAGLIAAVQMAVSAPAWAGHNWDALSDTLRDLSWLEPTPRVLLLDGCEHPATMISDPWCTLLAVCREAVARWASTSTPLRVALR